MTITLPLTYLVRLYFPRALHTGADVPGIGKESSLPYLHSDTLYSALVNTWADIGGDLEALVPPKGKTSDSWEPALFISSAFPFAVNPDEQSLDYYLPRPLLPPPNFRDPDPRSREWQERRYGKEVKELSFVRLRDFCKWIAGDAADPPAFPPAKTGQLLFRAQHTRDRLTEATGVYFIGETATDNRGSGLYCLVRVRDEALFSQASLKRLFEEVGRRGLGGRRSTGSGFYREEDCEIDDLQRSRGYWQQLLNIDQSAQGYVSLSLYNSPQIKAKDCYAYRLAPRQGRMYSTQVYDQSRRKRVWMFAEGSVFYTRSTDDLSTPPGRLVDVTPDDFTVHKVYRYGYVFPVTIPSLPCRSSSTD